MPINFQQLLPFAQADNGGGTRDLIDSLARTPLSQVVILISVLTVVRLAIFPLLANTPAHKRLGGYGLTKVVNEVLDAVVYAGTFVFLLIRPFVLQAFVIPSGSMWPTLYVNDFIVTNKAIYRFTEPKINDVVVFRPPAEAILDPKQLDSDGQVNATFVKRCIGLPGDLVEIKRGILYRNGQKVAEPYVHYSNASDRGSKFVDKSENERAQMTLASFKWVKWNGQIMPLSYTDYDANAPTPHGTFSAESPYMTVSKYALFLGDDQKRAVALPAEKIPAGMYMMLGDNRNHSMDGRVWGLVQRDDIVGRSELIWLPFSRWRLTR